MPFTSFEAEDPAGADVSGTNDHILSLAFVCGNNAQNGGAIEMTIASTLLSWGGKPVPSTGQMFPSRTA